MRDSGLFLELRERRSLTRSGTAVADVAARRRREGRAADLAGQLRRR
jgi:hypothetical protein